MGANDHNAYQEANGRAGKPAVMDATGSRADPSQFNEYQKGPRKTKKIRRPIDDFQERNRGLRCTECSFSTRNPSAMEEHSKVPKGGRSHCQKSRDKADKKAQSDGASAEALDAMEGRIVGAIEKMSGAIVEALTGKKPAPPKAETKPKKRRKNAKSKRSVPAKAAPVGSEPASPVEPTA